MSFYMTTNPAYPQDESHQYQDISRPIGMQDERAPTTTQKHKPIIKYVLAGIVILLIGGGIGFAAAYGAFKPTSVPSNRTVTPTPTPKRPDVSRQCGDIKKRDPTSKSGLYSVYPDNTLQSQIEVYCDMDTDGGGWLAFQRRNSGLVDFYRDWEDFAAGFGYLQGEFWLGNRHLHTLTSLHGYELRIDLEDFGGEKRYAKYIGFQISAELDGFRLSIGNYSGTAGDSLTYHNGARFSTKDVNNDVAPTSCAQKYKGAWWYTGCHASNLNGQYLRGNQTSYGNGVNWKAFRGYHHSMRTTVMSMRPLDH